MPIFLTTTFGQALAQARARRHLSQQELARLARVSRSTVCRWETLTQATGGKTGITDRHLAFLRDYFGADLAAPGAAAPDAVGLAYWLERAERVAESMEAALAAQRQLIAELRAATTP